MEKFEMLVIFKIASKIFEFIVAQKQNKIVSSSSSKVRYKAHLIMTTNVDLLQFLRPIHA